MRIGTAELIEKYGSRLAVAEAFLLDELNSLDQEEASVFLTEELILGAKIRLESMGKLTNLKRAGKAGAKDDNADQ